MNGCGIISDERSHDSPIVTFIRVVAGRPGDLSFRLVHDVECKDCGVALEPSSEWSDSVRQISTTCLEILDDILGVDSAAWLPNGTAEAQIKMKPVPIGEVHGRFKVLHELRLDAFDIATIVELQSFEVFTHPDSDDVQIHPSNVRKVAVEIVGAEVKSPVGVRRQVTKVMSVRAV